MSSRHSPVRNIFFIIVANIIVASLCVYLYVETFSNSTINKSRYNFFETLTSNKYIYSSQNNSNPILHSRNGSHIYTEGLLAQRTIRNTSIPQNTKLENKTKLLLTWKPLPDRMGSRVQMALATVIIANYSDWDVCFPRNKLTNWMQIPFCPEDLNMTNFVRIVSTSQLSRLIWHEDEQTNGSRYFYVAGYNTPLWRFIAERERESPQSILTPALREWWATTIKNGWIRQSKWWDSEAKSKGGIRFKEGKQHSLGRMLWRNSSNIHVAVHMRRGDISSTVYGHAWIPNYVFLRQIQLVEQQLEAGFGTSRGVEVHIFSEKLGFDVKQFKTQGFELHLAGALQINAELLRDWTHFVDADVLIVGSTFSAVPALARGTPSSSFHNPQSNSSLELPITLYWGANHAYFDGQQWAPQWWNSFLFPVQNWDSLKPIQLSSILENLGLDSEGSKPELIHRLQNNSHRIKQNEWTKSYYKHFNR